MIFICTTYHNLIDLGFKIIGALGAIGTFCAFIYLIKGHKSTQKQINSLTKIVDRLTDMSAIFGSQLKLSVSPDLYKSGGSSTASKEFHIEIKNRGEKAVIQKIINNSDEVKIRPVTLPQDLEKGENIKINGYKTGTQPVQNCTIDIDIIYEDKLKNKYSSKIQGIGIDVRIVEIKEL